MVIFNSVLFVYQRVNESHLQPAKHQQFPCSSQNGCVILLRADFRCNDQVLAQKQGASCQLKKPIQFVIYPENISTINRNKCSLTL